MRTHLLLLVTSTIAVFSSTVIVADDTPTWNSIACPDVPPTLAVRYETVEPLERFREDAQGWSVIEGDQQAAATLTHVPEADRLDVEFHFRGREDLEYVEIATPLQVTPAMAAMAMRYTIDGATGALRARVKDRSGETHQFELLVAKIDGEPDLAILDLTTTPACWGGDGNQQLDAPCSLYSIVLDRPQRGHVGQGLLRIESLAEAQPTDRTGSITVEVAPASFGNVYRTGARLALRVTSDGRSLESAIDGRAQAVHEIARPGATVEIPLPTAELGYHACRLRAMDEQGRTTAEKRFSYAVLPEHLKGVENHFLGMCTHFRRGAYPIPCMDLMRTYALHHFRDEISWGNVERQRGQFELPDYGREFLAAAQEKGLTPLLILDYGNSRYEDGGFPNTDQGREAYARYCRFLADASGQVVSHFEIWNEWTVGCGMRGKPGQNTPDQYARLIAAAAPAVRQARPDATIVGIGGEHSDHHFENIRGMFQGDAGDHFDVFSVHSYRYPRSPESTHLHREIQRVGDLAAQFDIPPQIWVTEIGWPTHTPARGVSESVQADMLVRSLAMLWATGLVERVYWYDFKDDGLDPNYNEANFGIVRHQRFNCAPKPAAVAAAAFSYHTAEATGARLTRSGPAWVVRFATAGPKQIVLAWSPDRDDSITARGSFAVVDQLTTLARHQSTAPRRVQLPAGHPIYLIGTEIELGTP